MKVFSSTARLAIQFRSFAFSLEGREWLILFVILSMVIALILALLGARLA